MNAIYNEIEPFAAAWLEALIARGAIAPGVVDRRSIVDLNAADVSGPGQRHFFAGIGVWSHALRLAGIPDDVTVWTGSCPCQPFSGAGKRGGVSDARHLWPAWFSLIRECRPAVVFGEQVASPDGLAWLDIVQADLEGAGYSVGAADLCAAGVGAPHIRQRLYFVAYAGEGGRAVLGSARIHDRRTSGHDLARRGPTGVVAYDSRARRQERRDSQSSDWAGSLDDGTSRRLGDAGKNRDREHARKLPSDEGEHVERTALGDHASIDASAVSWMAHADLAHAEHGDESRGRRLVQLTSEPLAGFWTGADWIECIDGVARPVEPGTFPLAHGAPARVGRLRGYGNGLCSEQAATFIEAAALAAGDEVTP